MKKISISLLILAIILILNSVSFAEEESYYVGIYPTSNCFYPGDKCNVTIDIYYYNLKIKGNLKEKLTLNIYEVPENFNYSEYEKYFSKKTPVKTIKKDILLENRYSNYWEKYFNLELPELPSGYYYISCSTPKAKHGNFLKISKIGLTVKSSGEEKLFFVQNRKTGETIKDATVKIFHDNKEIKTFITDKDGLVKFNPDKELKENDYYRVAASKGKETAEAYFGTAGAVEIFKGYIYTDRPVYRPDQKVNFKAVLRYQKNDELLFAKDEEINIIIKDPQGGEIYNKKIKTDEYGALSGDLILKKEPPLGNYTIYCNGKNNNSASGNFKVEEYRKPEFEIILKPEKENYIQGDKIDINMESKYYFGAPVADTEYAYEIYRNYYYYYSYFYWWEEAFMPYSYYGGQQISSGKGKTDKDGKAKIFCKTEKVNYDASYIVVVKMIDKSRREVSSSSSSLVTRGEYHINIDTDRYNCSPKEKINVKIKTSDYSQKPVMTEVEVHLKYEKYNQKKKCYEYDEVKKIKVKTNNEGIGYCEVSPEKDGYYLLECTGLDRHENKIIETGYFYCTSSSGYYDWYRFSNVEIIPDKKYYKPGDEANILIICPFDKVKAMVTVEGNKILHKDVMMFPNKTGTLKLKMAEDFSPNFTVNVCFYYDGSFRYFNKEIICPREDKFLTMEIKTDKEKYKPRNTAKFTIETKDYKNKPVSAQVTMGLADESVYAIAEDETPNMQKFFYSTRNTWVYTYNSEGYEYPYDYYRNGKEDFAADSVKTKAEALPPPPAPPPPEKQPTGNGNAQFIQPEFTRSYFPDTAYFNPSIITDQNGKAEVLIPLPDTLTTWRATGHGVTQKTEVGETIEKIIVTKDLLARLILPRFLSERDETVITGIIHNYLKTAKTVKLTMEANGGVEITGIETLKITVPPGGSVPVDWDIKVKRTGDTTFKLTALTDEESDAIELTIPILPHGTEKYSATSGSTKDMANETLTLPAEANRESATCRIILDPSLASSIFSSLEYLVGYPYGCVEQTMSRFLPNIIVSKTLGEMDIYNEKINKDLPDMVDKGLKRLYDYHHSDGGWGWWENDESHPFMTAYVIYGLTMAKEAGYNIDKDRVERGIKWLKDNYGKQKEIDTKAYMAFSVTMAGGKPESWLIGLYNKKDKLNNYSKAVLAISLHKSGLIKEAKEMATLLEKSADTTGTTVSWSAKTDAHGWSDNPIEATAYGLKALVLIKPESTLIPKIIRFLTWNRKGNYWYSTKDTAAVVMAMTDYIKTSKEMSPDFTADIYFNGTKIKSCKFTKEDVGKEGKEILISSQEGLLAGKNTIKIEMKGKGILYYAAYMKYYTKEENIKSENGGISVKRTYYLIKKGKDGKIERTKLGSSGNIKVNCQDIIEVEIELAGTVDYEYMLIEDPKPAGCEVQEESPSGYWNYWYAHREVRDEKVAFFGTYFWRGKHILNYKLRAETPGTFHTMPSRAYLMYSPEIGGNSEEIILEIKEKENKK